jgi:epoxyqueuosine reductase
MKTEAELREGIVSLATSLGFARVGFARAEPLGVEAERLRAFLAEGRHGTMRYLEETADVRANPAHADMLPSAKTVVVFATPYARAEDFVGIGPGRVARYARGRDYHNVLDKRMRKVAKFVRASGYKARQSVDSMPVFERAWAERAGIGFVGKNACVIIPGLGSHVLLTTLVTSAELEPDAPMKERCGACTRCLDVCPTNAFVAARELDARKCISYLTIEHRGPVEPSLREQIGSWLFGCDACQDVCPFNRTSLPDESSTAPFAPAERWSTLVPRDVFRIGEAGFHALFNGSPVSRAHRNGLARNVATVLGNSKDKRHLPLLREVVSTHDDAMVRDAADWAIGRIEAHEGE